MKRLLLLFIFSLALLRPFAVEGSGFAIFTQGAAALGEGDAAVAHAVGPSALFFNPALINRLPGTQLEVGTTLIVPRRTVRQGGETAATRDTVFFPSTFYLTHAFTPSVSAGIALFSPFGLGTDWGGGWSGRYLVTDAEITSYNINPAVSWRPHRRLALAAGVDFVFADARLEGKVPSAALGLPPPSIDLSRRFSGSGEGVGFNLGAALDLGGATLGVSYRSPVRLRLRGDLALEGSSPLPAASSLTLPPQLFAALSFPVSERGVVEVGARWEGWSSLDVLRLDTPAGSVGPETGGAEDPKGWHDTVAVNVGGSYRLTGGWRLSAGYLYGFNPVPQRSFEPAIPDADTHLFCAGAGFTAGRAQVDLGYGYQLQLGRTKSDNLYGSLGNGRYDSRLHLVGISVGYRF